MSRGRRPTRWELSVSMNDTVHVTWSSDRQSGRSRPATFCGVTSSVVAVQVTAAMAFAQRAWCRSAVFLGVTSVVPTLLSLSRPRQRVTVYQAPYDFLAFPFMGTHGASSWRKSHRSAHRGLLCQVDVAPSRTHVNVCKNPFPKIRSCPTRSPPLPPRCAVFTARSTVSAVTERLTWLGSSVSLATSAHRCL